MNESSSFNRSGLLTNRQIVWTIGIAALIALIAFAVNGPLANFFASSSSADDQSAEVRVLPVNVAEIEFVDSITQSRTYTGTIRARHLIDLGF